MKYRLSLRIVTLAISMGALVLVGPAAGREKDIGGLFQQGRAAYYQGNLELARDLLNQVISMKPDHFETKALLAQIKTAMEKSGGSSLKKRYSSVVIPKLELAEVNLTEALQALTILSKNASNGATIPNFIVKDPAAGDKSISLVLSSIPLVQAIDYLADLSGTKAVYDNHAVVFHSKAAAAVSVTE